MAIQVERNCCRPFKKKKFSLSQAVYIFMLQRTFHIYTIYTVATFPDLIIFTLSSILLHAFYQITFLTHF